MRPPRIARASRLMTSAPGLMVAAGLAAILAYNLVPGTALKSALYDALAAAAVTAFAVAALRAPRGRRLAPALISAGLGMWLAADVATDIYEGATGGEIPFPSFVDPLYLAGYPLLAAGLLVLTRRGRGRDRPPGMLIDALTVTLAFALASWVVTTAPSGAGMSLLARGTLTAYPAMDVLLLVVLVGLLSASGRVASGMLPLLLAGIVAQLTVDTVYAAGALRYEEGSMLDSGWLFAYTFLAAAALTRPGTASRRAVEPMLGSVRLVLLAGAVLVGPAAVIVLHERGASAAALAVACVMTAVLALLVVLRLSRVMLRVDAMRRAEGEARDEAEAARHEAEATRAELAVQHRQLLDSEARFRHIFEAAAIAIVLVDETRAPIAANPALVRLAGYRTEAEVLAVGLAGLTHPEDLTLDRHLFADLVAGRRDSFQVEKRYVRADGSTILGRLTYSLARRGDGSPTFAIGFVEDVTERRRAEAALRESEARLEQILRDAPIGMAVIDAEGRYVRVNPAFSSLLGYREDELPGMSFTDVTMPEEVPGQQRTLERMRAGEIRRAEFEKRYVHRDGREIWTLVTISRLSEPRGDEFAISQVQDIGERKRADEALRASERRLRAVVHNIGDGIISHDDDRRIVDLNPAACRMLGGTPDEIVGLRIDDITRAGAVGMEAHWARFIASGGAQGDWALRRLDGTPVEGEFTAIADYLPGEHLAIVRDVTERRAAERERRESEERWRSLVENLHELVLTCDDMGRLLYVNAAVERWLGRRPQDMIGRMAWDLIHEDDQGVLQQAMAEGWGDATPVLVWRMRHRDGDWRTFEGRGVDRSGDPLIRGFLITARDVSERLELEREVERMESERLLSQRLEAVGSLAAGVAHEINTPIQFVGDSVHFLEDSFADLWTLLDRYRALVGEGAPADPAERLRAAELAEEESDLEFLEERIPKAFGRVFDGVERVTTIVRAMKSFSHPPESVAAPADLGEAIRTTLTVCRNEYKYVADIELDLEEMPQVVCNIGDLNQVFLNLVVNAAHAIEARYADSGTRGSIRIRTRHLTTRVTIEVADDGCGIDPAIGDRVFDPFFTTKEVGKGSGQGLAFAKTIVERHGGTIGFTSVPGEGTVFRVALPAEGAGAVPAAAPGALARGG